MISWFLKLNQGGNIIWQKCLGGTGDEIPYWHENIACWKFV
jgi:hypothetical protein